MILRYSAGAALAMLAAASLAAQSPALPGGMAACVTEGFDAVTTPALPPGWFAWNAVGGGPLWTTLAGDADTLPNMAWLQMPSEPADKRLDSPPIPITSIGAFLAFAQNFAFRISQTTIDGGVLEVSLDGGYFQDVTAAGATFVDGGYNGTIGGNPLDGRPGWIGQSGWSHVLVDLGPNLAGHTATFRWRLGSGGGGATASSWFVDSVAIAETCGARPVALRVDEQPAETLSALSPVNGVLEPGETVVIDPVYQAGSSPTLLAGTAAGFTGPDSGLYAVPDGSADYGSIAAGAAGDCFSATGDCYTVSVAVPPARPAFHWDADLAEDLSDGTFRHWKVHIGETFADVPPSNLFYRYIETILHRGVTDGCNDSFEYCPDAPTLRQQMAVFVLVARFGPFYAAPACTGVFVDVPCTSPFAIWIEDLYARGVVAGCGPGPAYCPTAPVTRQQMAVFLLKMREGADYAPPSCSGVFADVPCANPFGPWIEELARRQITGGCGGGNYCPTHPTTRGQMAPFLVKTFGLQLYGT